MKKEEIPQDESNLSKSNIKELCYATDENGNYTTGLSSGWKPKTIALENSLNTINERIEEAIQAIKSGKASPIIYYMELHRMDWTTLADYVGMWKWNVKRHAKPTIFNRLNQKKLQKYADAFEISVDELINFKGA